MAETRKLYNERGYYAEHQGDTGNIPSSFLGLGYYRRTSLEDVINNFIVAYVGEEKALSKIPRYEVDFWAQRGMQEFSYDVLHSEKSIEAELGPAKTFPLPQDYVSLVQVSFVGEDGIKKCLLAKKVSIESVVILDKLLNFTNQFDKDIKETIIWPTVKEKIIKYKNFIKFNPTQFRLKLKEKLQ